MRIATFCFGIFGLMMAIVSWHHTCIAQAPPTIEAELSKYGIPITVPDLQAALKNSRPEVRSLAAGELGSMKHAASVPLIEEALKGEKDLRVRFNMARALLWLHSQVGNAELSHICNDESVREDDRLDAALDLVDIGDFSCLSAAENILRRTTSLSMKSYALEVFAHAKVIPAPLMPAVHKSLLASLRDPHLREEASQCIAAIGDKDAAPDLRAAIGKETDGPTRASMEKALETLERLP